MARVAIAVTSLVGAKGNGAAAPTFTTGDAANDHSFALSAGDRLIIKNVGVSTVNAEVVQTNNRYGRSIAAGGANLLAYTADQERVFGPLEFDGWAQSDGTVYVNVDSSDFRLAVLRG